MDTNNCVKCLPIDVVRKYESAHGWGNGTNHFVSSPLSRFFYLVKRPHRAVVIHLRMLLLKPRESAALVAAAIPGLRNRRQIAAAKLTAAIVATISIRILLMLLLTAKRQRSRGGFRGGGLGLVARGEHGGVPALQPRDHFAIDRLVTARAEQQQRGAAEEESAEGAQ